MPKYTYAKLRGRIIEKFGTQERFAEHIGISNTSMSKKMTRKTSFSQDDMERWSRELDIPLSEIGQFFFT